MNTYQYKARDKLGRLLKGVMGADSADAVSLRLRQMGYAPVVISQKEEQVQVGSIFDRLAGVGFVDLNMFTRQFYCLQKAGLPLLGSLNALKEQSTNKVLKDTVGQIIIDVEGGSSLSAAMERHPRIFNVLYVNMIKAAEVSGKLDEAFQRLATLGEHDEIIRLRIKSASRYPLIVVVAVIIGFAVLTTLVVPRFAKIYSRFTVALPLPTLILLWLNYAIRKFWWLLIIISLAVIFSFHRLIHTKGGRFLWDGLKLRVPVFGPLLVKLVMSRFARTTSTLMHSGVPILQILELVSGGVGNVVIVRTIDNIKVSVNEGRGMLEPMKMSGVFPPVVIQMVAVGEETGKLDELLLHVSDYYDLQVDYTLNNLVALIEPLLIVVLGLVVLFMALGIFLPMWNLMSLFKR